MRLYQPQFFIFEMKRMSKPLPSNSEFKSKRETWGREWERREGERGRKYAFGDISSLLDMSAIFSSMALL